MFWIELDGILEAGCVTGLKNDVVDFAKI